MPGSRTALIVVDMLNHYEHADAGPLMTSVREALPAMARLVERAQAVGTPVVYVNDNHGDWSSGRDQLVERALGAPTADLVEPIVPPEGVAFIAKARHSIFYETQLEYMLREQDVGRLIPAGQVTEQCILYSALDAYVRHFAVVVPRDAVAAIHGDLADAALRMMAVNMDAEIVAAEDCRLGDGDDGDV